MVSLFWNSAPECSGGSPLTGTINQSLCNPALKLWKTILRGCKWLEMIAFNRRQLMTCPRVERIPKNSIFIFTGV